MRGWFIIKKPINILLINTDLVFDFKQLKNYPKLKSKTIVDPVQIL